MKTHLILFMVFTVLVSCTPSKDERRISTSLPDGITTVIPDPPIGWDERWLKKIPCEAPCWENITPGKTSASEAEQILRGMPFVYKVIKYPRLSGGYGEFSFRIGNDFPGYISYDPDDPKTVWEIYPPINTVEFSEVISAFGEPTHVSAVATPPPDINAPIVYSLSIIYLNHGILLRNIGDPQQKPEIKPGTRFTVSFFPPPIKDFEIPGLSLEAKLFREWEGIKNFDNYCLDLYDGYICKGNR